MARVTIEDCLRREPNHFNIVLRAASRARELIRGSAEAQVNKDNDKSTVVALRELAEGLLDPENQATPADQTNSDDT